MQNIFANSQTEIETVQQTEGRSWVKNLDLSRYMGWGQKMFPDIDAQDYIRELRDCDRTF